jgi:hypothetical protein
MPFSSKNMSVSGNEISCMWKGVKVLIFISFSEFLIKAFMRNKIWKFLMENNMESSKQATCIGRCKLATALT